MNRAQDRHHQIDQDPDPSELFPGESRAMAPLGLPGLGPGKREVDLYVRTYMTLLQSSGAISVSSLEPAHITAASSLHAGATEPGPDMNAFIYSSQRLPACITTIRDIVLGQSAGAFQRAGFTGMSRWQMVSAPGRRRRWLRDGDRVLAGYIASASDLDDLVPTIVAYQIEWNKMHRICAADRRLTSLIEQAAAAGRASATQMTEIGKRLQLNHADWLRLRGVWGDNTWTNLALIAAQRKRYTLRMVSGSYLGYSRATRQWWTPAAALMAELDLVNRPVYFISSNTHSIVNILSGAVRRRKEELAEFIRSEGAEELTDELLRLEAGESRSSWDNLLYFAGRSYFSGEARAAERARRADEERAVGIHHLDPTGAVDVGIQIIELAKLDPGHFDPRLRVTVGDEESPPLDPRVSDAVIVNVNYPLGLAAYHIMSQVGMSLDRLRGIYILGKAATLNGRIGDVMIANVVYDEHSGNTYWFDNCFGYADLDPFLVYGAALDNQRAVTVKGTYLQNQGYLDFYYRENYTVVEMEAGPYLDAIYEDVFLRRYPAEEAINLRLNAPGMIDLGIIHYASDTPYTRAQTLGARGLSYFGMDSTYASTITILRRVFQQAIAEVSTSDVDLVAP